MGRKEKTEVGTEVGKGIKKNPTQIWPYLFWILFDSFSHFKFSSNFSFCFLPILRVEGNMCKTLGIVRVHLLGSLELVRVDLFGS